MKNQHFGENRDLLKFDLVNEILLSGLAESFVYVPMLTPDDPGYESDNFCRNESSGGRGNTKLLDFLDYCVVNDTRQVSQLENYFKDEGYRASVYCPQEFVTAENRQAYFEGAGESLQPKALILIDPDEGLAEDNENPANMSYSEIKGLYNRMDTDSILMFTQRFPDEMYEEYLNRSTYQIKAQIAGVQPVSLDDLDSIIFFLTRSDATLSQLVQMLKDYTQKYAQKADQA
jgi:hypothetical protein